MWKYVNIPSKDILFQASSRAGHYDYNIYEYTEAFTQNVQSWLWETYK